jgi:RHS repeat-associated protein
MNHGHEPSRVAGRYFVHCPRRTLLTLLRVLGTLLLLIASRSFAAADFLVNIDGVVMAPGIVTSGDIPQFCAYDKSGKATQLGGVKNGYVLGTELVRNYLNIAAGFQEKYPDYRLLTRTSFMSTLFLDVDDQPLSVPEPALATKAVMVPASDFRFPKNATPEFVELPFNLAATRTHVAGKPLSQSLVFNEDGTPADLAPVDLNSRLGYCVALWGKKSGGALPDLHLPRDRATFNFETDKIYLPAKGVAVEALGFYGSGPDTWCAGCDSSGDPLMNEKMSGHFAITYPRPICASAETFEIVLRAKIQARPVFPGKHRNVAPVFSVSRKVPVECNSSLLSSLSGSITSLNDAMGAIGSSNIETLQVQSNPYYDIVIDSSLLAGELTFSNPGNMPQIDLNPTRVTKTVYDFPAAPRTFGMKNDYSTLEADLGRQIEKYLQGDWDQNGAFKESPSGKYVAIYFKKSPTPYPSSSPTPAAEPDLIRTASLDLTEQLKHLGLVKQINVEDLKQLDLYLFRESDGVLIASRQGLPALTQRTAEESTGNPSPSSEQTYLDISGNSARLTYLIHAKNPKDIPGEPTLTQSVFDLFSKLPLLNRIMGGDKSLATTVDYLRAGEWVKIVAIHRPTGYIGSARYQIFSGLYGYYPKVDPIKLAPPNLKIWAERSDSRRGLDNTMIGTEGSSLDSDNLVFYSSWADADGSPLPSGLAGIGYTARIAYTSKDGKLSSITEFPIKPGEKAEILRVADPGKPMHYYIHLSGAFQNADFADEPENLKRPKHYVPFQVPVFDPDYATERLRYWQEHNQGKVTLTAAEKKSLYRWFYRPELQISTYQMSVTEALVDQTIETSTAKITASVQSGSSTGTALQRLGVERNLIWNLAYLQNYSGIKTDAMGQDTPLKDEKSYTSTLAGINKLSPADILAAGLYQKADEGNPLWEAPLDLVTLPGGRVASIALRRFNIVGVKAAGAEPFYDFPVRLRFFLRKSAEVTLTAGSTTLVDKQRLVAGDYSYVTVLSKLPAAKNTLTFQIEAKSIGSSASGYLSLSDPPITHRIRIPGRIEMVNVGCETCQATLQRGAVLVSGSSMQVGTSGSFSMKNSSMSEGWDSNQENLITVAGYSKDDDFSKWLYSDDSKKILETTSIIPETARKPNAFNVLEHGVHYKADVIGATWKAPAGDKGKVIDAGNLSWTYMAEDGTAYHLAMDETSCDQPSRYDITKQIKIDSIWYRLGINPAQTIAAAALPPVDLPPCVPAPLKLTKIVAPDATITNFTHYVRTFKWNPANNEVSVLINGEPAVSYITDQPLEQVQENGAYIAKVLYPDGASINYMYRHTKEASLVTEVYAAEGKPEPKQAGFWGGLALAADETNLPSGAYLLGAYSYEMPNDPRMPGDPLPVPLLKVMREGSGNVVTYEYRKQSKQPKYNISKVTNGDGQITEYTYYGPDEINTDASPHITGLNAEEMLKEVKKGKERTRYSYSLATDERYISQIGEDGSVLSETRYKIDNNGKIEAIEEPLGRLTQMTWNDEREMTKRIDPLGGETTYVYGTNEFGGKSVTETDPFGRTSVEDFDDKGRLIRKTDKRGYITEWQYNDKGYMVRERSQLMVDGVLATVEKNHAYSDRGQLLTTTDSRGKVTRYIYDEFGHQTEVIEGDHLSNESDKLITHHEYTNGLLTKTTSPTGEVTRFEYDEGRRLSKTTNARGDTTEVLYYASGEKKSEITKESYSVEGVDYTTEKRLDYEYNPEGHLARVIRTIKGAGVEGSRSAEKTYSYDVKGQLVAETDWEGHVSQKEYDSLGRLVTQVNELAEVTGFRYETVDAASVIPGMTGKLAKDTVIDPLGRESFTYRDSMGRVVVEKLPAVTQFKPDGSRPKLSYERRYEYDFEGNQTKTIDEMGYEVSYTYGPGGQRIKKITDDGAGGAAVFEWRYDAAGNLIKTIDEMGGVVRYEYDDFDRKIREIQEVLPVQHLLLTDYDKAGRPVRMVDPWGFETRHEYDALGHVAKRITPSGTTEYLYTGSGIKLWERSPTGSITLTLPNALGEIFREVDPMGRLKEHTYDAGSRRLTSKLSWPGQSEMSLFTAWKYDAKGQLTELHEAVGTPLARISRYGYDKLGHRTTVTDPAGHITRQSYDELGRLVVDEDATGLQRYLEYNGKGGVVAETDRRGTTVRTEYNHLGLPIKKIYPLTVSESERNYETMEYDPLGRLVKAVDRRGAVAEYEYDAIGRVTASYHRISPTASERVRLEQHSYDLTDSPGGPLTARRELMTDAAGNAKTLTYDHGGRVTMILFKDGSFTKTLFDAEGREQYLYDEMGHITEKSYYADGTLKMVKNPLGSRLNYAYDLLGKQSRITTELGHLTQKNYDALGRLSTNIDALGGETRFSYDQCDNLIRVENPLQKPDDPTAVRKITDYGYNTRHERTSITQYLGDPADTDPEKRLVTTMNYDPEGALLTKVDPLGHETRYSYNAMGWETSQSYPDAASPFLAVQTVQKEYDAGGNLTKVTEHKKDSSGAAITDITLMSYDSMNRLASSNQRGELISYSYDANGNKSSVTSGGKVTAYSYTYFGKPLTETHDGKVTQFEYEPNKALKKVSYPNGASLAYSYDDAGQLTKVVNKKAGDAVLSQFDYTYDADGNRSSETEQQHGLTTAPASVTTSYQYDALNQLTGFDETVAGETKYTRYRYDGAHNREHEEVRKNSLTGEVVKEVSYLYGRSNQLLSETDQLSQKTTSYQYDKNGSLIAKSDGVTTTNYAYDSKGQLTEAKKDETTLGRYDYDYRGMRSRHLLSERGDIDYYYDGDRLIDEKSGGARLAHYRGLSEQLSLEEGGGSEQYFHYKALGTTTNLTSAAGEGAKAYRSSPWGEILAQEGSSVNRQVFTGQEIDERTGMVYFGARYYNPEKGRFPSPDSLFLREPERCFERPEECQLYSYVVNNPVRWVDRDGRKITVISDKNSVLEISTLVQVLIAGGAVKGMALAAANLQHWFGGSGSHMNMSGVALRAFPKIMEGEEKNLKRFQGRIAPIVLNTSISKYRLADHYDAGLVFSASDIQKNEDLYYAAGNSTITSTSDLRFVRNGPKGEVSGEVLHHWKDRYDWHPGKRITFKLGKDQQGNDNIIWILDTAMKVLEREKGAAEFDMDSKWKSRISKTFELCVPSGLNLMNVWPEWTNEYQPGY